MTPWMPADPYHDRKDSPVAGGVRPINQGDVFARVPLVYGAKHPPDAGGHKAKVKEVPALLTTHPCSARKSGDGELNDLVTASPVQPVAKVAPGWAEPWDGNYALFPLPALIDGYDYVANLALSGMVSPGFFDQQRIAVLNRDGLAALQHRLNRHASRINEDIARTRDRVDEHWLEFDLWELWTTHRGTEEGFQAWLGEWSATRPESTRRNTLKFDADFLLEELRDELGAPPD
jgi:hypothetical protein